MLTTNNRLQIAQAQLDLIARRPMIHTLESLAFSANQYTSDKAIDSSLINQVMSANGQLEAYCLIFLPKFGKIDIDQKLKRIAFKAQVRSFVNVEKKVKAGILDVRTIAFEEYKQRVIIENKQLLALLVGVLSKKQTLQIAA